MTAPTSETTRGRLRRVMYVAVLDPSQKFGSLEEQVCFLSRAFREQGGCFVPLFLRPSAVGTVTALAVPGLEIHCLDLCRFRFLDLARLLRLVWRHRIEVVHWNFSQPIANPYLWWLTMLAPRTRHYFTDHTSRILPLPPPKKGWKRFVKSVLLRRYAKVLAVSRFVQDCLERECTWPCSTCCLHFVNTERFRPDAAARAALRSEYGVENGFVLLVVAHLIPEKGIDVALRAMKELPADVMLWVAGGGREAERLQGLGAELGLSDRVRFLGLQADVVPYLQAADCFVCPSLWAEAAGLVNLEAQACGLPVIASRVGGIPEYVEDGLSGLFFDPGDSQQLATCIRSLYDNRDEQARMAKAARALAVERFSPQSRLNDYLNQYRD